MAEAEAAAAGATDASAAAKTEEATALGKGEEGKTQEAEAKANDAKTQEDKAKEAKGEEKQTEKDAKAPEVPEKYDLKLPDGAYVDDELMGKFTDLSKEHKLSNESVQKFADLHLEMVSKLVDQQIQAHNEKVKGWAEAFKADKDLQGSVNIQGKQVAKVDAVIADARKVIDAVIKDPADAAEFKTLLNETGIGNHRLMIKFTAAFAQFVGEDGLVAGTPRSSGERTAAEVLYGKS